MQIEVFSVTFMGRAVARRKNFKVRLPNRHGLFTPDYIQDVFLVGDIIVYKAAQMIGDVVFVAVIESMSDEDLNIINIKRPQGRDQAGLTGWMPDKISIKRKMVLCELVADIELETGVMKYENRN